MRMYQYSAINCNGNKITEIDEANNPRELYQKLIHRKFFLLSCKRVFTKFTKIKTQDLLIFLKHIKYQHGEVFSLIQSIKSFIEISDNKIFVFFLKKVLSNLVSGESISKSFVYLTDNSLINFFLTLEHTGNFNDAIDSIIGYIELRQMIKNNFFNRLKYPIVVLLLIFSIFIFVNEFIVPAISEISQQSGTATSFIILYKTIFALTTLFGIGCLVSDKFLLINPLTKNITIRINNWYFSLALAINMKSKLLLTTAIEYALSSISNFFIRQEFAKIKEDLLSGISLSESMSTKKYLTPGLKEYIETAEVSNKFCELLNAYNRIEEAYITSKMKNFGAYIAAGVTIFSGLLLICILFLALAPVYSVLYSIDMAS